jgi:hypothetical protein
MLEFVNALTQFAISVVVQDYSPHPAIPVRWNEGQTEVKLKTMPKQNLLTECQDKQSHRPGLPDYRIEAVA